ncbi:MAG: hypothetical protein IKG98_05625 [Ruminococcus sp.]|nr:hypothetical protein [Ruminococcus sp.]
MNDTDMLYMAAQEKELEKVKAENMKMKSSSERYEATTEKYPRAGATCSRSRQRR